MTRVAVVGFASEVVHQSDGRDDAELLAPLVESVLRASGVDRGEVGVLGTASSEFLNGVVGGVMGAFDALPGWPPRTHSHIDGEGAFAFYESWVRLRAGEAKAALVCAFSRPLGLDRRAVLGLQMDPYLVAPLSPGPTAVAALQARMMLDHGRITEVDLARVVSARRAGLDLAEILGRPYVASPLRDLDCSTVCSGAAAVLLAVEDVASRSEGNPAWITGMEHRTEVHSVGARDLSRSPSTEAIAASLDLRHSFVDVLEVHAPFSHQEPLLVDSIGAEVGLVNPSGGALPADPVMATGLIRIGAAARAVMTGEARSAVGHATNGPCLQHNLLCVLDAEA